MLTVAGLVLVATVVGVSRVRRQVRDRLPCPETMAEATLTARPCRSTHASDHPGARLEVTGCSIWSDGRTWRQACRAILEARHERRFGVDALQHRLVGRGREVYIACPDLSHRPVAGPGRAIDTLTGVE